MNSMQTGFDWEKNKPYQIKKRKHGQQRFALCVAERFGKPRLPDNFAPRMG